MLDRLAQQFLLGQGTVVGRLDVVHGSNCLMMGILPDLQNAALR
jgi:hypothetical protein